MAGAQQAPLPQHERVRFLFTMLRMMHHRNMFLAESCHALMHARPPGPRPPRTVHTQQSPKTVPPLGPPPQPVTSVVDGSGKAPPSAFSLRTMAAVRRCLLFASLSLPATRAILVDSLRPLERVRTCELPQFLPTADVIESIAELEARSTLTQMEQTSVQVATRELCASIPTVFWRQHAQPMAARPKGPMAQLAHRLQAAPMLSPPAAAGMDATPRVLLLHGADASTLEWRFVAPRLSALGIECVSVDWWSGGWTDRAAIQQRLAEQRTGTSEPWTLVRQHLRAFWQQELDGRPVVVVGASLGGAVALDFARHCPEAVAGLVLVDAGGESYASPPPQVVSALAPVALGVKKALAFLTARLPSDELRINSLHRTAPGWGAALGAYLESGGYGRSVDRQLIRQIRQPTLVVWGDECAPLLHLQSMRSRVRAPHKPATAIGSHTWYLWPRSCALLSAPHDPWSSCLHMPRRRDPILPVEDAYRFQDDLPQCVGVREVPGAGHTPQLDDPDTTALHIAQFAQEVASLR